MERRKFLGSIGYSALMAAGLPLTRCALKSTSPTLLILGGTNYLGPAIAKAATNAGFKVTLFNRGVTNPDLFPELEKLIGDRSIGNENLKALQNGRTWDFVLDTWPADPRMVERTAKLLKGRVKVYGFTSSIAVYSDKTVPGITEASPVHQVSTYEEGMSYYQSKVLCEQAVKAAFPTDHLITRPPGIHGERDESWTLVYWLWRLRNGGDVLAPGDGNDPVQYIDVNDVANFTINALSHGERGTFNTIGPRESPLKWDEFLDKVNAHYGYKANLVWVSTAFLKEREIRPVIDLPIWEPQARRPGRHTMSSEKAIKAGLTFTPIEQTFEGALNWYDEVKMPATDPGLDKSRPFNGMTRERELSLLREWNLTHAEVPAL